MTFTDAWADRPIVAVQCQDIRWAEGLFDVANFGDTALAQLAYFLARHLLAADEPITKQWLQRLRIPEDYARLWEQYQQRRADFARTRNRFFAALAQVDVAVNAAFGVTSDDAQHLQARLATFPLNRVHPRYPWGFSQRRSAKRYLVDRYR